jgi:histone-lysine N-methyltransferase SETD2
LDAIIALAQQSVSTPTRTPIRTGSNSPAASSPRAKSSPAPRPVEEIWEEEERRKKLEKEREREKRKRKQQAQASASSSERDDKRAKKLIGDVVVPVMSKYKQKMDRDQFKRFAQQCTELLMEKEKKGKDYAKFCRQASLGDDKRKKIQAFASDYTIRLLKKMEAKAKSKEGPSTENHNGDGNGNGHGSTSHEPSTTPGDSFVVATPELAISTGRTPANDASDENYGDSDLEMDIDIDAELEDHTFSVVKDRNTSS